MLERVVAKLTAIVDTDLDPDRVIRAGRLLASEDLRAAVRELEDRPEREAKKAWELARIERMVEGTIEKHPDVTREQAEQFASECLELVRPKNLTETLKDHFGFWTPPAVSDETLSQIWHELGLPGDPGPEPRHDEPKPAKCGLRELFPPDQAYLHAQRVEEERERRELVKNPEQKPGVMTELDRLIAEAEEESRHADGS